VKINVNAVFTDGHTDDYSKDRLNPGFSIEKRFVVFRRTGARNPDGTVSPGIHQLMWALEVCKIYACRGRIAQTPTYRPEPKESAKQPRPSFSRRLGGEREK